MSDPMSPAEQQALRRQLEDDPTVVADILNHLLELTGCAQHSTDDSAGESPFAA